jgi:hypothetical protein
MKKNRIEEIIDEVWKAKLIAHEISRQVQILQAQILALQDKIQSMEEEEDES